MKSVQRGLFPTKDLSTKTSVHMRGEQAQAKYHLQRSEPVEEKPVRNLNANQFHSQLRSPYDRGPKRPAHTQLPMFMSAKEIGKHYQVLDGDRQDHVTWSGNRLFGTYHGPETDNQVLDRKYDEAQYYSASGSSGDEDYGDYYGDGPSLAISIRDNGVEKPIHLQAPERSSDYLGSRGRPEIYGGHHRYAVMRKDHPNDLMPVRFYANGFWEARGSKDYT